MKLDVSFFLYAVGKDIRMAVDDMNVQFLAAPEAFHDQVGRHAGAT